MQLCRWKRRRMECRMEQREEVKMTFSGVLFREGKHLIQVRFERGDDVAEGTLPEGEIHKSQGYSKEEIEQLEQYLRQNRKDIIARAKELNRITSWF